MKRGCLPAARCLRSRSRRRGVWRCFVCLPIRGQTVRDAGPERNKKSAASVGEIRSSLAGMADRQAASSVLLQDATGHVIAVQIGNGTRENSMSEF